MGYFSEQSIIEETHFEDYSYPSFDGQLLWRLDDLSDRYAELVELDAPCFGEDHYTNDDYRYAPVECFETLADVARAIEIAKADLECNCLIIIDDKDKVDEKKRVKLDAYFRGGDLIDVPDANEFREMIEEIRKSA